MRFFIGLFILFITFYTQAAKTGGAGHEYDGVKLTDSKQSTVESLSAHISIDETKPVSVYSSWLFGYNFNWRAQDQLKVTLNNNKKIVPLPLNPKYLQAIKSIPFPLNRMSGTGSQFLQWKKAVGPVSERIPHKRIEWAKAKIQYTGPVEWINSIRKVYPSARFVWVLNMTKDSPGDARDLAEFFMGKAESKWGAKRKLYGLNKPVVPAIWELGNELDWGGHKIALDEYIKRCKETIKSIRSVHPNAVFAAHAATAPWTPSKKHRWKEWHRKVLKELGPDLQYLSFHPYYRGYCPEYLLKFINALIKDIKQSSNPSIKLFISEHAKWPPGREKGQKEWRKNWYQTHALTGCLDTAEWLLLMINNPEIGAAAYHSHSAGPWGLIYRDKKSGKYFTTGIAEMFKLFSIVPYGSKVIDCKVDGQYTNSSKKEYSFSSIAVKAKNEKVYIIMNNRLPSTCRQTAFNLKNGSYCLEQEFIVSAFDLHSCNSINKAEIKLKGKSYNKKTAFKTYTVPAKSLVLLVLKKL